MTAEDGRIYERSAIEAWFHGRPTGEVRSPVTNELMGTRLFRAVQVRNSIRRVVESGAITGAEADAWRSRLEEETYYLKLAEMNRRRAEKGDVMAMRHLSLLGLSRMGGLTLNESLTWLERGALDYDDPLCLSLYGRMLCSGEAVERNVPRGFSALERAAKRGSRFACFWIGGIYEHGWYGLPQDLELANGWYDKMESCIYD